MRKRPGPAIGIKPWMPKQLPEFYKCPSEFRLLTSTSPCEVRYRSLERNNCHLQFVAMAMNMKRARVLMAAA